MKQRLLRRTRHWTIFVLACALGAVQATATASAGRVLPGWPKLGPAGTVWLGASDDAVVHALGPGPADDELFGSYSPAGLRWLSAFPDQASDHREHVPEHFSGDRWYRDSASRNGGPFGSQWSTVVTATGQPVTPRYRLFGTTVTANPNAVSPGWTTYVPYPTSDWRGAMVLANQSTVFVSIRELYIDTPDRVAALDATTGAIKWIQDGSSALRIVDETGVLLTDGRILNNDGSVRTKLDVERVRSAYVDQPRRRVYVLDDTRTVIRALDMDSGAQLWTTTGIFHSVAADGTVLVSSMGAVGRLRAITPEGRIAWRVPTFGTPAGAQLLRDGTVLMSDRPLSGHYAYGLVTRIDPRRAQPAVSTFSVTANRTRIDSRHPSSRAAAIRPNAGVIVRIASPTWRDASWRVLHSRLGMTSWTPVRIPAGVSYVRLGHEYSGRVTLLLRSGTSGPVFSRTRITVLP